MQTTIRGKEVSAGITVGKKGSAESSKNGLKRSSGKKGIAVVKTLGTASIRVPREYARTDKNLEERFFTDDEIKRRTKYLIASGRVKDLLKNAGIYDKEGNLNKMYYPSR
jgi:hypothetical protein